jgi:enterochelin esterase-like enzyme
MRRILTSTCAVATLTAVSHAQLQGTLQQWSFTGPVTNRTVFFNIYLPPGYNNAGNTTRYPVVYHLHGLGGSQGGPQNTTVPASFEAAFNQGLIGRVIVVFPNAYTDSFWADSFDMAKPTETDVVRQVIPFVDSNFRTIPTRGARIIQGFSMGGFGATKFYSKFPHLFAACVEYDGALLTWTNLLQFHPTIASSIFNNSESYFNDFSPWRFTTENADILDGQRPIRMVVGSLVPGNQAFRNHLQARGIPVDYVETTCGHEIGCLLSAQGLQSAAFIAASLNLTCPTTCGANCDCSTTAPALNVADFTCFLNRFAAADPRANCDSSTQPPILNVADFSCFLQQFASGCP